MTQGFFDTPCPSSHWPPGMTWDILLTLRDTWGFYLNHVHQSLSLKLIEWALHNVLLEHGELPDLTGLGLGLGGLGFGTGLDNNVWFRPSTFYSKLPKFQTIQCFVVNTFPLSVKTFELCLLWYQKKLWIRNISDFKGNNYHDVEVFYCLLWEKAESDKEGRKGLALCNIINLNTECWVF